MWSWVTMEIPALKHAIEVYKADKSIHSQVFQPIFEQEGRHAPQGNLTLDILNKIVSLIGQLLSYF